MTASIYLFKPPYAIGSVPSLSGHAIAYRWRSLPRVHRHRFSKPQGSSKRVLPWQVTMDQLICASLSHTHYWYKVGMLKVPAIRYCSGDCFPKFSPIEVGVAVSRALGTVDNEELGQGKLYPGSESFDARLEVAILQGCPGDSI